MWTSELYGLGTRWAMVSLGGHAGGPASACLQGLRGVAGDVSRGRGEEQGLSQECRNHDPDVAINNNSHRSYFDRSCFYGWKGQWVTRRMPALSPWIRPSLHSRVLQCWALGVWC